MARMVIAKLRLLNTSFVLYIVAVLALTLGKTWFTIGGLWKTGAHEKQSINLIPFEDFVTATTWFAPIFNLLGNIAMFLPFGLMLGLMLRLRKTRRNVIILVALAGLGFSFSLETLQYILKIGYSDMGDLLSNTAGAAAGARFALELVRKASRLIAQLMVYCVAVGAVVIFALLGMGPVLLEILPEWLHFAPKSGRSG
ncbi:VanZ like family protein [Corynebacterium freiburgense]|nr:VanZ like family protein [Corynebacterium freiburgense]